MRVTDLDEFSLEQIWRPYQGMLFDAPRLVSPPMSLEDTAEKLRDDTEWSRCVLNRLRSIGVTFPPYIAHPLVDVVRAALASIKGGS